MKFLRYALLLTCMGLFFVMTGRGVSPVSSQSPEPTPATYQITVAELGYGEARLESLGDAVATYVLRLPEHWILYEDSFFDLDFSYVYESLTLTEDSFSPTFFGNIVVAVDGQPQYTYTIEQAMLEHVHLEIPLPIELLNDFNNPRHTIEIALQAGHLCRVPHQAHLVIHPLSFFSLSYEQLPVNVDLSRYPRPFYQGTFEGDRVRFVLPTQSSPMNLAGTVAVAAKLGDLTSNNVVISGTTDLALLDRLSSLEVDENLEEHLVIVGRPEANAVILTLDQLDALPISLKARQLSLSSQGLTAAAPGSILTYTLKITNTTDETFAPTSLIDTFSTYAQVVRCIPDCPNRASHAVSWTIPSLGAGVTLTRALVLRLNEVLTGSVMENTATLLNAESEPLNVSTLTTTVYAFPPKVRRFGSSVAPDDGYFFWMGERAVPEHDGVVQVMVSPWNQARAILVITGLSDQAIYKACRAMGTESYFPGMEGNFALVRDVRSRFRPTPVITQATDLTFADLGYEDRTLSAFSQDLNYYFDIPADWRMTDDFTLDLHFSHSQLINYEFSYLSVFLNQEPVATVTLNEETALGGALEIRISPSLVRRGDQNRMTFRSVLEPTDRCVNMDIWLLIKNSSLLHLGHIEEDNYPIDLDLYPNLFTQRRDLADVLFMLPSEPDVEEWAATLRLAASLGQAAGASTLIPMVTVGKVPPETALRDYHFIAVGRPSRNPLLQQINAQLPQPFQPGSDVIVQQIDDVIFRLSPDLSLGLVQFLVSPWNEKRGLMAVTGTTDAGVKQSTTLVAEQPWRLGGNLILIQGERVNVMDTRGFVDDSVGRAVATAVSAMSPTSTITTSASVSMTQPLTNGRDITSTSAVEQPLVADSQSDTQRNYPSWIIPLVIGTVAAVIIIFVVAFWQSRRKRA